MPDERCDELREPVAELALGIASGEQRARVLDHTGRCASCQRLLGEFALVGDELLQLAPEHEPPPGFEVRVIEWLGRPPRPRRRRVLGAWRGAALAAVAAALAAAAVAVAVVLEQTEDERRLGGQLQAVLSRANGKYLAVTELRNRSRREAGLVFHYGGEPSWIFVTLERPLPPGRYLATLVTRAGATRELGTFQLGDGALSFGATTRVDLLQVTQMRLRAERGGPVYTARFQ
jgi:hypothetical protein